MSETPLPSPPPVWILGHSYVYWGARRADARRNGRQLGFARDVALVRWLGVRGLGWSRVLQEVHKHARLDRPPEVLVLHVGGNDLGERPFRILIKDIKHDLLRLWMSFPGITLVWSEMVARRSWRKARSVDRLNKARAKVNRAISKFVSRNGGVCIRHVELERTEEEFWLADGVHLNAVGIDLWALGLQGGIERALRLRGVSGT
ncbi:uncharacterized protein ACNLHF_009210 [Anomaloglossus baeobatrachus]